MADIGHTITGNWEQTLTIIGSVITVTGGLWLYAMSMFKSEMSLMRTIHREDQNLIREDMKALDIRHREDMSKIDERWRFLFEHFEKRLPRN